MKLTLLHVTSQVTFNLFRDQLQIGIIKARRTHSAGSMQ